MKRLVAACLLATLLLVPATSYARRRGHHHHNNNAVAWGILGGIVGGILIDQALAPAPVIVRPRTYVVDPYYDYAPYGGVYIRRTYESYRPGRRDCGRRGWTSDDRYRY